MANISISAQRFPWGFLILSYIGICVETAVPENCWVNLRWHSFIQYIEAVSRAPLQERSVKLNLNLGLKSNTWQWHHNTLSPALLFCLTYISADPFCLSFPFCDPPELPFWTRWPHTSLSLSTSWAWCEHLSIAHTVTMNNEMWFLLIKRLFAASALVDNASLVIREHFHSVRLQLICDDQTALNQIAR